MVSKITIRPEQRSSIEELSQVRCIEEQGLQGDHYSKKGGKRQVTFIMQEHIDAAASILGVENIDPSLLRRNIVVKGINLLSLKDGQFIIGEATFEYTGLCHPCSRMEENLGKGGYNAMRGHGGITAKVIQGGTFAVGHRIYPKACS